MRIALYASAAAAAGTDGLDLATDGPLSADELRDRLGREVPDLVPVLKVSSLLVDGQIVHDGARTFAPDDQVDVLPPFAGG